LTDPAIARETLSDQVHSWLRRQILSGRIKQGEHLSELAISRETGVSATPVREALRMLHGKGIVEFNGRRGARVIQPTEDEIRHCFAVRESLERLALREASKALRAGDHAELLRLADTVLEAGPSGSQSFFEADRAFHTFFIARAGNSWLTSFLATLEDFLVIVRQPLFKTARRGNTRLEHQRVAQAVVAGRIDDAEQLLAQHIQRVCGDVLGAARRLREGAT
jgi:DNA-binding GntR family transcriptional regulator